MSGTLKLELAQYRSLEAFALFASDLDATSRRQLDRGARLTELLRQPRVLPVPGGGAGRLDLGGPSTASSTRSPSKTCCASSASCTTTSLCNTKVLDTLRDTNVLDDDTKTELEKAVDAFSAGVPDR